MTLSQLSIPGSWDEITPAWMTDAIRGRHPDSVVEGVEVVLRDDGTNRRARLALTYSAGTGPATVFAKAVDPAHAELVALTSGLFTSVGCSARASFCRLIIRRCTPRSSTKRVLTS